MFCASTFHTGFNGSTWNKDTLLVLILRVMVFNATFNNISSISQQSVILGEETGVPGKKQYPVVSHWQTLSHNEENVVSSKSCHEQDSNSQLYFQQC